MDDVVAMEKHLDDFKTELTKELVSLHEAYERNIQSLGGVIPCSEK
jgi:hypothetical protein